MAYGSDIPVNRGTQGQSSDGKDTIIRVGDVSFVDEEVPTEEPPTEESTPDNPPPSGPLGDIVFNKTVYSKNSFNRNVNVSFNELNQAPPPIDLSAFFRMYNNLFFDIPKEGEQSHNSIIKQSIDYIRDYIDPKDEVIRDLEEQIRQLELDLAQPDEAQEHPVFKNGSMIRLNEPHQYYYMDKGYRRYVNWNDTMVDAILLASFGTIDKDLVPIVTTTMLENIPQGYPNLSEDNFGEEFDPRLNEVNNVTSYLSFIYDQDGLPSIDPRDYNSSEDFFDALNEDILQKKEVRAGINQLISQLTSQIAQLRVLDPDYYNETYGSLNGNDNGDNGNNGQSPAGNY